MKRSILFSLFFLFVTSSLFGQISPSQIFDSIQSQTHWKPINEARSYDPKTLSSFHPKNASILNEYGFTHLDRQEFQQHEKSIAVEIYEMVDPTAAYGIFTFFRSTASQPLEDIGNSAEEQDFKVSFLQNSYYIKLASPSRSPRLRPALLKMASIISDALPKSFSTPPLVKRLPKENLVKHSEVFILGFRALNQKYPFGDKDLFGLANGGEAVMAEYRFTDDSAKLLLISYPTQHLAKKFLESGYREYAAQDPNPSLFFKREGPLVIMVLGSKSAEIATALLDKVSYVSTVTWDPKTEPLNVGRMMVRIFIYIGFMLTLTLVAGLTFGVARIILKRILPDRIFDRSKNMEIIRLNLPNPKK